MIKDWRLCLVDVRQDYVRWVYRSWFERNLTQSAARSTQTIPGVQSEEGEPIARLGHSLFGTRKGERQSKRLPSSLVLALLFAHQHIAKRSRLSESEGGLGHSD